MTDFTANLTPIVVPALAGNTAANIATYQANFTSNIVAAGNSVLQSFIAQKATDFFAIGDLPNASYLVVGDQGVGAIAIAAQQATAPTIDYASIENLIDAMGQLALPAAPTLDVPSSDTPTLDAVAPTLSMPTLPGPLTAVAPSDQPSIESPALPDAPTYVLPPVPTFEEFGIPDAPGFSLPTFSAQAPANLLNPPTAQFSYVDPGYTSQLQDPLIAKLLSDLVNGGYGIDPNDETMLWFRARDRAAQEGRTRVKEVQRRHAATAFPMPQGAYYAAIEEAEEEALKALSEANRDIALKRADLYVENRRFTIQEVRSYEQVLISLYNATQERALNYSKAVVEMGIAIYDASVRNYNAQLDAYKTEATVFESKIRAELAKTEIYRAQIQAQLARVEFNKAKIEQFRAQLEAIQITVDLYKSRLAAANVFMDVQRAKLAVFQSEVQNYATLVGAKESEYRAYLAGVQGQLGAVDLYRSQIQAYNAKIEGLRSAASIKLQANEALLQQYRTAVTQYTEQLRAFQQRLSGRLDEARVQGLLYTTEVDAYRAYTSTLTTTAANYNENSRQFLDAQIANLQAQQKQVEFRLKQLSENVDLQKDINIHAIDFLRSALGGAVSGVNSLGVQTT